MSTQSLQKNSNWSFGKIISAWPRTIRIVAVSLAVLIFGSFLPAYAATVTITAHAGGIRTGATTVDGLPNGAVFTAVPVSGSPVGGPFNCTTSGGTGSCAISVPSGFQWDVSLTTAPANYYLNPSLDFGSSSTVTADTYEFRTGTVNSNIDVPGSSATGRYSDVRNSGNNYFSGLLAASYNNPPVSQKCGLNVALLLDQSGSMAGSKQTSLKQAANDTIDALVGTPSNLAIYTFSASTGPSIAKTSTASSASARPLRNFVNGLASPSGSTNWDSGINQIPSGFDLVIFATDGNPTTYDSSSSGGSASYFQYVEQGVFSSNRLKSTGVRVVGVGIGLDGGQENLRAVSGATLNSDYYLASTSGFGEILKSLATGACNNQLSIQKVIEDPSGNPLADSPFANGWGYSNTISAGSAIDGSVTTGQVNGQNGFASATVTIPAGATPTISVTETLKTGYVLQDAECSVEGLSVNTTVVGNVATFTAKANVPMSCVFTNRALATNWSLVKTSDPASGSVVQPGDTITYTLTATNSSDFAITSATATDDISNIVDDATLGALPAGLTRISNTLTWSIGTITAHSSKQVSYTVTVNQDAINATLTNVATPGNSGQCSTREDCTTTHKTPAVGYLTLIKNVNNGQTGGTKTSADWTLSADGGSGGSQIVNSSTGILHKVIPSTYTLSESLQQVGYTTDGVWACTGQDAQTGQPSANVVVVGLGEHVTCTITNTASDPSWVISKTSDPTTGSTVLPGQTISYTVTLSHVGGVMPANTVITDDLSGVLANATFDSVQVTSGSAQLVGSTLTWNTGSFTGSATMTYSVQVNAGAYGVNLTNVVTPPTHGVCDPSCTTVQYTPHYTINKTSDPTNGSTTHADEVVTYSLNVQNDSSAVLTGATATDTLVDVLDNATLVEPLNPALTFDAANAEIKWSIPTLLPGETATVSYSVRVTALNVGNNLKNVVIPDASGDCLNDLPSLSAADEPALSCMVEHKIVDIDMAIVTTHTDPLGQTAIDGSVPSKITYQLTVKNNGPIIGLHDSTGVVVNDPMLAKLLLDPTTIVGPDWDFSASTPNKLVAKYIANSGVFVAGGVSVITFVATIISPVAPGGVVPVPGLDNKACVAAEQPEQNLVNNCSADAVNVKWVALDPLGACRNGIPYMDYAVPLFDLNADGKKPTIALIWWKNGDYKGQDQLVDVNDTAAMLASGAQRVDYVKTPSDWVAGDIVKGTVLWPGAVLDANGAPIDWPGMSQRADGSWYFDPSAPFYKIRKAATVEVRITNSATSTYVPVDGAAIAACHPDTGELAHTGFPATPLPIQAGLVFAGLATLYFAIRRRNYGK